MRQRATEFAQRQAFNQDCELQRQMYRVRDKYQG